MLKMHPLMNIHYNITCIFFLLPVGDDMYDYLYESLADITVTHRISYVENCQHIDILYQSCFKHCR